MKKVFIGLLLISYSECIFSMMHKLNLQEGATPGSVGVQYNGAKLEIRPNTEVDFGGISIRNAGGNLSLVSNLKDDTMHISSGTIPLTLDSFKAKRCQILAPEVKVLGRSAIDEFGVAMTNLDISGKLKTNTLVMNNSFAEINGFLLITEEGKIKSKGGDRCNILVNGTISACGDLKIDASKSLSSKIINNGKLKANLRKVCLAAQEIDNALTGKIWGSNALFIVEHQLRNNGKMTFNQFLLSIPEDKKSVAKRGYHLVDFLQKGTFDVSDRANIECLFDISGPTHIGKLVFPYTPNLNISGTDVYIGSISGEVSIFKMKDGAEAQIDSINDGVKYLENSGGQLLMGKYHSGTKTFFSIKADGEITVGEVESDNSFIHSDSGKMQFSNLKGKLVVSTEGTAKLTIDKGSDLTLNTKGDSKTKITDSHINTAFLRGKSKIKNSSVNSLDNQGELKTKNTRINKLKNDGKSVFQENNEINKFYNAKDATFESGTHQVNHYIGEDTNATIKANGGRQIQQNTKPAIELSRNCEVFNPENSLAPKQNYLTDGEEIHGAIKDGDALVTFSDISGASIIEASDQIYDHVPPRGMQTIGDIDIILDRIPLPCEVPLFEGNFRFNIDLLHDFVNEENVDYNGASFRFNMNGHNWINRKAIFQAGGLSVQNASVFGNDNGIIALEKDLRVQANRIFNEATPIAIENGRWVHDTSFWRAHAHFYMPATYYKQNRNTGILAKGNIIFDAADSIENKFSTIATKGGFFARAGNTFSNTVGTIAAKENSLIVAPEIFNKDLGTTVRKGEFHARGRCGWGFGRHTWHYDLYVSEVINKSDGSMMLFCDTGNFVGTLHDIGSTIAGRRIKVVGDKPEIRSVLQNQAVIETDDGLTLPEPTEANELRAITMQLWSIE